MLGNRPPVLGASWQPMAGPAPQQSTASVLAPKIIREVLIFGGLTILAARTGVLGHPAGWLAVLIGRGLVGVLPNLRAERRIFRTVLEWAAVAALAAIVVTASPATTHKVKTPHLKAPVNVEASQTDYLNQAKEGVVNLYEQIATGFSKAAVKPKKEGR